MTLQRRLLHAMLGLLGLAALAGVSTVFLSGSDFVGRLTGTLVIAAFAMGFAIPASRRLDRQESRAVGVCALGLVVVGFTLGVVAIWGSLLAPAVDEQLAITALMYLPCAAAATVFLELRRSPAGRLAGTVGLLCTAVAFSLWALAIWGRWASGGSGLWGDLAGTGAVAGACALAFGATLFGTGSRHAWRWIGVGAAAVGAAIALYGIWFSSSKDPTWVLQPFIVAAAVGVANLLLRVPLQGGQRWLLLATTAAVLATAVVASVVNIETRGFDRSPSDSLAMRMLAAGAIVSACGVLAVTLLVAFGRRMLTTSSRELSAITHIAVTCPRCGVRQQAALGESNSSGCGLVFLLRVAEPRCPRCDHLLFDLKSEACPECGTRVRGAGKIGTSSAATHASG